MQATLTSGARHRAGRVGRLGACLLRVRPLQLETVAQEDGAPRVLIRVGVRAQGVAPQAQAVRHGARGGCLPQQPACARWRASVASLAPKHVLQH